MSRQSRELSRRQCLESLASVAGASVLAGCPSTLGEASPTPPTVESTCSGGDTAAPDRFDEWLLRLGPEETTGSTLTFATGNTALFDAIPPLGRLVRPYLVSARRVADHAALAEKPVERTTILRPPGETRPVYTAFRLPGDELDRRTWFGELKRGFSPQSPVSFEELDDYRGYTRYRGSVPPLTLVAYDDEHVLVLPKATPPVTPNAQERLERLVDTRRGETRPHHCYDGDARRLFAALAADDLVFAWVRTDGEPFGSETGRVPNGASASAFHLRVGSRNRPTAGRTPATARETAATTTDETETVPGTSEGPAVALGLTVAFPDEPDTDAVRDHVRERRTATADGRGLRFLDPTYRSSGRVASVTETRSLASLLG